MESINEAFPTLTIGFYKTLCKIVKLNKITDFELTRAVNHVIAKCKFPNPMVGEFISFILDERPRPEERPEENPGKGYNEMDWLNKEPEPLTPEFRKFIGIGPDEEI